MASLGKLVDSLPTVDWLICRSSVNEYWSSFDGYVNWVLIKRRNCTHDKTILKSASSMQKKSVFLLHVKIMYNLQKLISDRSHKPNWPNYLKNLHRSENQSEVSFSSWTNLWYNTLSVVSRLVAVGLHWSGIHGI